MRRSKISNFKKFEIYRGPKIRSVEMLKVTDASKGQRTFDLGITRGSSSF